MPDMKHTLWTQAFILTGAAAMVLLHNRLDSGGTSTDRARGRGRGSAWQTIWLAGSPATASSSSGFPSAALPARWSGNARIGVDTEGHEPCTSI
jgi:hypothetical protein